MNAIKIRDTSPCCPRSVMLFVDGELDPSKTVEVEEHLKVCEPCASQVELVRSMRASLRRSCTRRMPRALESRVLESLHTERPGDASVAQARVVDDEPGRLRGRARVALAVGMVAVAACFVLIVVVQWDRGRHSTAASAPVAANDEAPFDTLLDEFVALHANPLPPEEKNPEELARFEPYVGVPVKRSAMSLLAHNHEEPASFDGARIHPIDTRVKALNPQGVAALSYKMQGHRVTVYVFNSRVIPLGRTRLRPRMIREAPVYVGHMRGYSVAATERAGIGYAMTTDLDEDKTVQMVASF